MAFPQRYQYMALSACHMIKTLDAVLFVCWLLVGRHPISWLHITER
jgi:hypothetical protein